MASIILEHSNYGDRQRNLTFGQSDVIGRIINKIPRQLIIVRL